MYGSFRDTWQNGLFYRQQIAYTQCKCQYYPTLNTYLSLSFHSDTLPKYLSYLPTVSKKTLPALSIYPIHDTSAYMPVPTSLPFITYPNQHFPTLYYCQGLIKYKAETTNQIRPKRPRTETTQAETTQTETTQNRNDSGPKRPKNGVAVVEQERACRVIQLIMWLSIFVRVQIFWTSNIFVINVFPYTHDTGAVTGREPGDEFYTLLLIEINSAAFQPFNTTLCIRDATGFWTSEIRCNDTRRVEL